MRPTIFFLLLRPQVSSPHSLMRLKLGDCSFSSLTLSLILSRSSRHFPVPDNFISIHPCPLTLLEHDRLSSLNWFTLSIFLTKWCKPFSCQQLCFLCPFILLRPLGKPQLWLNSTFPFRMHVCVRTHVHTHTHTNWDISPNSQIFKGLSMFRLTSISFFLVLLSKDNPLTYPYNLIHLPFLKDFGSLIFTPSPLTFPLAYK